MSNKIPTPSKFEKDFFAQLRAVHPTVFGHMCEVFKGKWIAVYMFVVPETLNQSEMQTFSRVRSRARKIAREMLGLERVVHAAHVDEDMNGNHCYSFWLPIPPDRLDEFVFET